MAGYGVDLNQLVFENMDHIKRAVAVAMDVCPSLQEWGAAWISGEDRSAASLVPIAKALKVAAVDPDEFARDLDAASKRPLPQHEMFGWITKGAILAALEWTRAKPGAGSYHEGLAGYIATIVWLMGNTWKAHGW